MNVAGASGTLACLKGAVDGPRGAGGLRHRIGSLLAPCTAATPCGATGWQSVHEWIQGPARRCRPASGAAGPAARAEGRASAASAASWSGPVPAGLPGPRPASAAGMAGTRARASPPTPGRSAARSAAGDARRTCPEPAPMAPPPRWPRKTVLTADGGGERAASGTGVPIPAMDLVPDIAGRTVTAGALPARTGISACPHGRGARFMLLARGNRKNPPGETRARFAPRSPGPADFATRPPRPGHGRTGRRGIRVSTDPVAGIPFPWAGQVLMVRRTVREYRRARNGKPATPGPGPAPGPSTASRATRGRPPTPRRFLPSAVRTGHAGIACTGFWTIRRRGTGTGAGSAAGTARGTRPPAETGDRPHPRARQAGRAAGQGPEPEPPPRARLARARPEHTATHEVHRVAPPGRSGSGRRNPPGGAGRANRHARDHAHGRPEPENPAAAPDSAHRPPDAPSTPPLRIRKKKSALHSEPS